MRSQNHFRLNAAMRWTLFGVTCALLALGSFAPQPVMAEEPIATLRGEVFAIEPTPPTLHGNAVDGGVYIRNYPEQPPIIPHKVRDYKVDLNGNKCLSCHSRRNIKQSKAPMVSVTHFMDRDGQILSSVTPRRYFCSQCHVPKYKANPLVENTFIDVDDLVATQ